MVYLETAKLKELKKFYEKTGYIYGMLTDVYVKNFEDDTSGTYWCYSVKKFDSFKKALNWYLRGSGIRMLGDDYDKREFEETFIEED